MKHSEVNSKIVSLIMSKKVESIGLKDEQINKILQDNSYITFCSESSLRNIVKKLCQIHSSGDMLELLDYFNLNYYDDKKLDFTNSSFDFLLKINNHQFLAVMTYHQVIDLFKRNVFKCLEENQTNNISKRYESNFKEDIFYTINKLIHIETDDKEFPNLITSMLKVRNIGDFLWLENLFMSKDKIPKSILNNKCLFLVSRHDKGC